MKTVDDYVDELASAITRAHAHSDCGIAFGFIGHTRIRLQDVSDIENAWTRTVAVSIVVKGRLKVIGFISANMTLDVILSRLDKGPSLDIHTEHEGAISWTYERMKVFLQESRIVG